MEQILQILGALMVLAAFVLTQTGRLDTRSLVYLLLNAVGAGILAVDAASGREWGFLLLEGTWSLVALWSLGAALRGRPAPSTH